ncbi:protein prenylyltransferase [Pterulicium gracile]|uniref:Protein farnesyltransferase/geranylgeranyltransferase type-1 subunit alpha n=1 Tax=Pterulicium gracile TaxID=1884261 RepID=A0A5C3QIA4_9AGAR|nr:protein prenylyltransferase [Pterula gracilis]
MTTTTTTDLYSDDPQWVDVTPIPQYDGINPVAPILYTDEYKDATDYFRGVLKSGEKSERVLELTERVIRMNPAHYTAWQYRYQTILALGTPLDEEITLMNDIAMDHLKTYQVWHHRRLILTQTKQAAQELAFLVKVLGLDNKNYHTWAYRQWILSHFSDDDLWRHELEFVDSMLRDDIRNNSAWHHRFFVLFEAGVRAGDEDREALARQEILYSKERISLAPNNASAWNYLRGVLDRSGTEYSSLAGFVEPYAGLPGPTASDADTIDTENPAPQPGARLPSVAALEFMADVYEKQGGERLADARKLWTSLAREHDTIRQKYWEYRSTAAGKL